jgi:Bacterial SH3 domain
MRLPKLDTIIILVFGLCIALWMMNRCNNRRATYVDRSVNDAYEREERPVRRDTIRVPAPTPSIDNVPTPNAPVPAPTPNVQPVPAPKPAPTPTPIPAPKPSPTQTPTPVQNSVGKSQNSDTQLYVTIDGLKVRKEPGLKSETVAKLELYEQVYFLNQKTDWTQEISLGTEKVTDRWVKIRTKSGKTGWVFGAGVNYYKEKRKGVLE